MKQVINKMTCVFLLVFLIFTNFHYSNAYKIEETPYQTRNVVSNSSTRSTKRSMKYLAIFVKFSDSDTKLTYHLDDEQCVENAKKILNSDYFEMDTVKGKISVPSFKKYYETQSYGNLLIETEIFPRKDGKVVSYEDKHPIGYYLKYSSTNLIGYKNAEEAQNRETELVNNAVSHVSSQIASARITEQDIDSNNDDIVDAISFFVEGNEPVAWGDLLWSHMKDNKGVTATIMGKEIGPYNMIYTQYNYTEPAGVFSLNRGTYGTIIHEFGHTLGYVDLYRFAPNKGVPVGFYDIMGVTVGSNPQNFLTYFVSEYYRENNWHAKLPVVNQTTKNITLNKPQFIDPNEKRAIKLQIDEGNKEYFVIEYHEKQITYDTSSADESGLIVYRVNENNKFSGNKEQGEHGEKEHIFVFRPGETSLGNGEGNLSQATLNLNRSKLGKTRQETQKEFDNQTIYYADGSNSGIVIEVINQTADTITFNVTFPEFQGDGTENNPYMIDSIDAYLYLLQRNTRGKYYKLTTDLDFKNVNNYPEISFYGILDGNHKTISNIKAEKTSVFGNIGEYNVSAMVKDLNIENIQCKGNGNHLGGFAGSIQNSTIKNVHVKSGKIENVASINTISSTGGLVGSVDNGTVIENCSSSASVTSEKNVGGMIGVNQNATIQNCYANGKVNAPINCGGFIGLQYIMDSKYKVPQNVYYDKSIRANAVGGYAGSSHNLNALPENELGKGIVGVSVPKQITIKQNEKRNYEIETTPQTTVTYSITSSDISVVNCTNHQIEGIKEGIVTIDANLQVGTQIMKFQGQVKVEGVTNPPSTQLTEQEVLNRFGLSKKGEYVVGFVAEKDISTIRTQLSKQTGVTLVSIKNAKGEEPRSGIIATNMKITLRFNAKDYTYTVVIKGDVNGDGRIFATDYVKIKKHIMETPNLQGAYLLAADVNNDNKVYATDYVRIRNYIMGSGKIEQTWNKI